MKTPISLKQLENELASQGGHESRKARAAEVVITEFKKAAQQSPSETDVKDFFTRKDYGPGTIRLSKGRHSKHRRDRAFTLKCQQALAERLEGNKSKARAHLKKAREIAASLEEKSYTKQYDYMHNLVDEHINDKCCIEYCYESINPAFRSEPESAPNLIGNGFLLAEKISDQKREADFLIKAMYMLFEEMTPPCPHVALSLGFYLRSSELETQLGGRYEPIIVWSYMLSGNIYIDLAADKNKPEDSAGYYARAKSQFELAREWALENEVWYTVMQAWERHGVACTYLNLLSDARKSFRNSIEIASAHYKAMQDFQVERNAMRCEIGLGNVFYFAGLGQEEQSHFKKAGKHYIAAHEICKRLNDQKHEKIISYCLKRLIKAWPNQGKEFPNLGKD